MNSLFDFDNWLKLALSEDVGAGDYSSLACIDPKAKGKAKLLVKQEGIIAGVEWAKKIFEQSSPDFKVKVLIKDGAVVAPGDIVMEVSGKSIDMLRVERLMLNVVQRMSGIATYTNFLASKIKHTNCKLLDTRKTTPLFRVFEKDAVRIGGGQNHRFGLYDMVMLKDNHIDYAGGIEKAIQKTNKFLKEKKISIPIEIEVRDLKELDKVLAIGKVQRIMLDNFTVQDMRKAVELIDGKYETEASGGINESTIVQYAETGVDYISVGALTHQIKSLDLSLKAV
jgi:nicotinate-nucleotide pyrophosphorylase (carboxylating)